MNRRDLLRNTAIVIGGSLLGADELVARNINWEPLENPDWEEKGIGIFSKAQVRYLNEIADTIIPDTDTPGARAAKVGQFIALIVSDCYDTEYQKRFLDGMLKLDEECKGRYGKPFMKCPKHLKHDHLVELDSEQKAYYQVKTKAAPHHYFRVLKDLVIWGYFSSEIGATKALRFVEIPGKYTTINYKRGDRAWGGY
jgi:hypothetical protein